MPRWPSAERPEAHVTLGAFYADRSQADAAEAAYRTALRLDPAFVPALVNLADLYRALQRDADGEPLLRQAVAIDPGNAVARHALGLLLLRTQRLERGDAGTGAGGPIGARQCALCLCLCHRAAHRRPKPGGACASSAPPTRRARPMSMS